jgi:hypothetical protein
VSLLKTIKAQLGLSGTAANNFTLDASADNGTMKLARGNAGATTQDILTVDANGKPVFNQLALSIADPGYITLPGGLIIQWGKASTGAANVTVTTAFPIAFPNGVLGITANVISNVGTNAIINLCTNSGKTHIALAATNGPVSCQYIAIGY